MSWYNISGITHTLHICCPCFYVYRVSIYICIHMNCIVLSQSLASYANFKEVLQKWRAEIWEFPKYRVAKTHSMDALQVAGHFSQKSPLSIGLFCKRWPIKIRLPMGLRHPVPAACIFKSVSMSLCISSLIHGIHRWHPEIS